MNSTPSSDKDEVLFLEVGASNSHTRSLVPSLGVAFGKHMIRNRNTESVFTVDGFVRLKMKGEVRRVCSM